MIIVTVIAAVKGRELESDSGPRGFASRRLQGLRGGLVGDVLH